MNRIPAIVFASLLAFSLSLWPNAARAQAGITIISVGPVGVSAIPLAIAQDQRLFAKYGLEARVTVQSVGGVRLVGKEGQFGYFGGPAVIQEIAAQGTDLKILSASSTGRIENHLVARLGITKPEDLRGKRLGVSSIGAGIWIITILALEHLGLDPRRDSISILTAGNLAQIANALEDGRIDAAVLAPAQGIQLRSKGYAVLLDMYRTNIYGPQTGLITTEAYLQQNPDVVEKVMTALMEATAFSLAPANKPIVLRALIKEFNLTDLAAAERGYESVLENLSRKPYPSVEALKAMQRITALHDPRVLSVKVENVIDDRVVRKLDASGMINRLYRSYGVVMSTGSGTSLDETRPGVRD